MSGLKNGRLIPGLLVFQAVLIVTSMGCGRLTTPEGWSAAVVATNVDYRGTTYPEVVYIGTQEGHLLALDGRSGETVWKFELRGEPERRAIYGTPALYEDVLYVGGYDGSLYVLSVDNRDLDELEVGEGEPIVGGAVVVDDVVLIGSSDGHLYAYEITRNDSNVTLVEMWRTATGGKIWSTPTVAEGIVYFGSLDHKLYAVSLSDGSPVWAVPFEAGGAITAQPLVNEGLVYVGSFDSIFYAIDAATGREEARFDDATGWFWTGALISNGTVYAPALDGNLYALDASNLSPRWSEPLRTGGPIIGSPTVLGDRIAVPSLDNKVATVHVVRLSDGGAGERCSFGSKNSTQMKASLVSLGNAIYLAATDHSVRKLELDVRGDPHEAWVRFTDEEIPASADPGWAREC